MAGPYSENSGTGLFGSMMVVIFPFSTTTNAGTENVTLA